MDPQEQVIAKILAGDIDLYAQIIRRHHAEVRRIVGAMLYNSSQIEEIVHQIFVDAFEHLDQFRSDGDFSFWIKEIARNAVRMELRRQSRESRRMDFYRDHLLALLEEDAGPVGEEQRFLDALGQCLGRLSLECQKAFQLRYTEENSLQDIAIKIGRSADAVRMMLARGRLLLRECIEKRMALP